MKSDFFISLLLVVGAALLMFLVDRALPDGVRPGSRAQEHPCVYRETPTALIVECPIPRTGTQ